jgi:hypothetical protein
MNTPIKSDSKLESKVKSRGIKFVKPVLSYDEIVSTFHTLCQSTRFVSGIVGKNIKKIDFPFVSLNSNSKKIKIKPNNDIEVSYYKWENNFCKSYLFYTDNLTLLDISEQLKKCILEVDNHLYAQTLLQDCSFYTPQFYRFYINIKPTNESFIIKFILMMEYIDIENDTIDFDEKNTTHLQQLKEINECLKKHLLTHNDLASRNIKILKSTEKILIYDWGESFISNYGINVLENMNRKELS